jgi:hypothetical protein
VDRPVFVVKKAAELRLMLKPYDETLMKAYGHALPISSSAAKRHALASTS